MSLLELLDDCARRGIELGAAGEELRVSAPIGAMTAALRESLRRHKAELIGYLNGGSALPRRAIAPAPAGADHSRLSVAQRSLWFLHELDPASIAAYTIRQAIRIEGKLDPSRWLAAFEAVVQRHDSLRTTFERRGAQPLARTWASVAVPFRSIDLRALPPAGREAELTALMDEDGRRPFDLAVAPLVRTTLVRLGESDWCFLFSAHHLVADAWSAELVLREMVAFYNGAPPASPRLQFADAVHWEAERLGSAEVDRDLAYWRKQLADLPVVRMPADRPPSAKPDYRGASAAIALPEELSRSLADLARAEGVTMFSLLLATCAVLLHRYTGAENLCIGTSVASREAREFEDIVGFFANLIVLRPELDRNASFGGLLACVHRKVLEAFARQQAPFDAVVKVVRPDRTLGQNPLFRALFLFLRSEVEQLSSCGLRFAPQQLPSVTSKFDLSFHVEQTQAAWRCLIEYKTSLFRRETIRQMLDGWLELLHGVAQDARAPISRLPIITPAARAELLQGRNQVDYSAVPAPTLHGWFAQTARAYPDRVALTDGSVEMTYAELDRRANRLAHVLVARGVHSEDPVGLCVDRSCDMIVAILAILKSGGCYVPLDPSDPPARRASMLAASRVALVVTAASTDAQLGLADARRVCVDSPCHPVAAEVAPPPIEIAAANAAYVIYTSGSAGRPRGVVVTHGNVTRLMAATQAWFGFDQNDVWTLFHSIAFDFSVWEMWGALLHGGRLVIVPYLMSRAPEQFLDLLAAEGVTVLNQTPSASRSLIARSRHERPATALRLRTVIFGGEALDPCMLAPWLDAHGDARPELFNMYGITETAVHVTRRRIKQEQRSSSQSLIGQRICDLRLYILDDALEPVPEGVVGEMHVGGAGLARGYLGLPGTTAERFLPDPHSLAPGARLYRTGDLACWRGSGDIEYCGRGDHQVKVRGFRIEPGEIEAVLVTHPHVHDCVVVARAPPQGPRQLIGYYLSAAPAGAAMAAELRALCQAQLPAHMVPAAFVQVDAWPLTRNGKLDRDALPLPREASRAVPAEHDPPRTATELAIAQAWKDVLGAERVGRGDDFFALGGDSMLSLEVLARLRAVGLEASVAMLYQHKRVAELAQALDSAVTPGGGRAGSRARPASKPFALLRSADRARIPEDILDAFPLSRAQAGILFEEQLSPADALYRDAFSFHVRLPLDIVAWQAEVATILAQHDALRTSLALSGFEEPLQLVHESGALRCTHEDVSALTTAEQEQRILAVVEEVRRTPYGLATPPLMRFHLLRRTHDRMQIVAGFHHAILDGWSFATLMTQLLSGYAARCRGRVPPPSPPPPRVFVELIALERAALAAAEHERFWREEVERLPASRLPRPALARQRDRRDIQQISVPLAASVAKGLRALAAEASVPLKSVLLAAHLRVLSFLTGESEVATGLTVNGRPEREGGERVFGLFVGTLPLRLSLARAHGSHVELVREAFAAERRLLAHRWYPLAEIKQRAGGRTLFETVFDFQHFHVYEAISKDGGIEVLGHRVWEETEFPLIAQANVLPISDALEITLIADTTVFPIPQIKRIARYYVRCLEGMASRTDELWQRVSLLSPMERTSLLEQGRNRAVGTMEAAFLPASPSSASTPATFPQLFAARAVDTPDAPVIADADHQLSYAELDRRANQVAHHLHGLGVGPEVIVALCLERSPELLVGLIAILKAGGVYLPLDPAYPPERLGFMLTDAGASVVMTRSMLRHRLPENGARVVCLDIEWPAIARQPATAPRLEIDSDNCAYVIYTSGSTGTPKGAMVTHRGMLNHLAAKIHDLGLVRTDVIAQTASQCFDISVWQFLAAPLVGGRVLVLANHVVGDPERLLRESVAGGVTVLEVVPSLLQAALDGVDLGVLDMAGKLALRWLMVTGEALPPHLAQAWLRHQPKIPLVNAYGPTECSDDVTHYPIFGASELDAINTPIGRTILNTQAYVLNAALEPVPAGVVGELYIAGAGVGRGYLGRPALTGERFVADPFGPAGARMYRTGDLARWRADGVLDFMGRADQQIKVRGFRVEPEEIAHVLRGAGLREAVVRTLDTRLVAYCVRAEGRTVDARSLRAACESQLPDYMVPAAYVFLAELPLTANGKLNVAALPARDASASLGGAYIAPRNAVEERLCAIWQQVLNLERIGVEERFFDLGGHSLHATQIVSRVRAVFGVDLPLRAVFDGPTVAHIAQRIVELEGRSGAGQDGGPARPRGRPRPRRRQRVTLGADGALVGDS